MKNLIVLYVVKGSLGVFFLYIVKDGTFDLDWLPYLANDVLEENWKFLGRRLGLHDRQINRIQSDNEGELYEQCYMMLREWRNTGGTFQNLADALHELGCTTILETYCLKGSSPSTKEDLEPGELSIHFFVNSHRLENNWTCSSQSSFLSGLFNSCRFQLVVSSSEPWYRFHLLYLCNMCK